MKPTTFETDAEFIRQKFLTLGKSTQEICAESGISKSALGRLLNSSRRIRNVTASKLYNYFGGGSIKATSI